MKLPPDNFAEKTSAARGSIEMATISKPAGRMSELTRNYDVGYQNHRVVECSQCRHLLGKRGIGSNTFENNRHHRDLEVANDDFLYLNRDISFNACVGQDKVPRSLQRLMILLMCTKNDGT
eukprot:28602-Pleurochrysis_carterae.AAC.1